MELENAVAIKQELEEHPPDILDKPEFLNINDINLPVPTSSQFLGKPPQCTYQEAPNFPQCASESMDLHFISEKLYVKREIDDLTNVNAGIKELESFSSVFIKNEIKDHDTQICNEFSINEIRSPSVVNQDLSIKHEEVNIKDYLEDSTSLKKETSTLGNKGKGASKKCEVCGKVCKSPGALRIHFMDHTGERPFECEICDSKFKKRYDLVFHMKIHNDDRHIACDVCGKKFIVKSALRSHMIFHTGEKPYGCATCGVHFATRSTLKAHLRIHTGERPYSCSQCSNTFRTSKILKEHIRTHFPENIICDVCNKTFKRKESFQLHRDKHFLDNLLDCPECDKSFKTNGSLKAHMKCHDKYHRPVCSFCGKVFGDSGQLKAHVRKHTGEMPYECNICGKRFRRRDSYRYHVDSHSGGKPMKCDICDKVLACKSSYVVHMRTHSDVKPYKCHLCDAAFKRSESLKAHRDFHDETKSHITICKICGQEFKTHRNYSQHMRKHRVKVHRCKRCRVVFEDENLFFAHKSSKCKINTIEEYNERKAAGDDEIKDTKSALKLNGGMYILGTDNDTNKSFENGYLPPSFDFPIEQVVTKTEPCE